MSEPELKRDDAKGGERTNRPRGTRNIVSGSSQPLRVLMVIVCLLVASLLVFRKVEPIRPGPATERRSDAWQVTGRGMTRGIGGLSLFRQDATGASFVAVFDSKLPGEPRIAFLDLANGKQPITRDLKWPGDNLPVDLEALTRVPDTTDLFVAATSGGQLWRLRVQSNETIELLGLADLPSADAPEIEGFDVQRLGEKLVAVWAGRGDGAVSGALCAGIYDATTGRPSLSDRVEFRAPWPDQPTVRHISDLRVDALGIVYVTSSMDPGNDGPFDSALYIAGTIVLVDGTPKIQLNKTPIRLRTDRGHKVEALEFVRGTSGLLLTSDDENAGGAVLQTWQIK
jgi:hypothetical protein